MGLDSKFEKHLDINRIVGMRANRAAERADALQSPRSQVDETTKSVALLYSVGDALIGKVESSKDSKAKQ